MKSFALGVFMCLSVCLAAYIVWEHHRHVPVLIKEVPVMPQMVPMPSKPDSNLMTGL